MDAKNMVAGMVLPENMDAIHEWIIRASEANERFPEIDLDEVSRAALKAHSAAAKKGKSFDESAVALEAAAGDSAFMRSKAIDDLDVGRWGEEPSADRGREFAYDFVFAALAPILGGAVVWWLAAKESDWAAKALFAVLCVTFALAALNALVRLFGNRAQDFSRLRGWNSVLVHSGGAILAGTVVLVGFVFFAQRDGQQMRDREMEARVEKVNQAAAVALSALKAGASVSQTQEAVTRATEVNWIHLEAQPKGAAVSPVGLRLSPTSSAELRVGSSSGDPPMLASFMRSKSGEAVPYADYLLGTVVKADLNSVTLSVGPRKEIQVLALARGILPPPVNSEVVAVVKADKSTAFLQLIDADLLSLKH